MVWTLIREYAKAGPILSFARGRLPQAHSMSKETGKLRLFGNELECCPALFPKS
jgi:hypothetical protein